MRLNHLNIQTNKIDSTVSFYCDVIGLKLGKRPDFDFEGAWLCNEEGPILHIMPCFGQELYPNFLGHIAFEYNNIKFFLDLLDSKSISFQKQVVPGSGEVQIFIKDPNNITVEIMFPKENNNEN